MMMTIWGLSNPVTVWGMSIIVSVTSLGLSSVNLDLNSAVVTMSGSSRLEIFNRFSSQKAGRSGEVHHAAEHQ